MGKFKTSKRFWARWGILLLCPAVLVAGNVLSLVLPQGYWRADKDSILNTWFVKRGWFWTSLVSWWCVIRYKNFDGRSLRGYIVRYISFTVWWYIFAQALWFGVAPLMDITFVLTGGGCEFNVFDEDMKLNSQFQDSPSRRWQALSKLSHFFGRVSSSEAELLDQTIYWLKCRLNGGECRRPSPGSGTINKFIQQTLTAKHDLRNSSTCRRLGGYWVGGHDPSGHVFLISLMSLLLLEEARRLRKAWYLRLRQSSRAYREEFCRSTFELFTSGAIWNLLDPINDDTILMKVFCRPILQILGTLSKLIKLISIFIIWENPIIILILLNVVWIWSFFITSVAFHSFWEQLTGLLYSYMVVIVVYLVK